MRKRRNKILPAVKSEILSQYRTGLGVSKLAKLYNISKTVIYDWLRAVKISDDKTIEQIGYNFVELSVANKSSNEDIFDNSSYSNEALSNNILEKASLTFNNISFVIEGRVKSLSLISIIKILGE